MNEVLLNVERMSYGADAIARGEDGKTTFIEGVCPGETVRAEVVEEQKRFNRARLIEVVEASDSRVTPQCPWADHRNPTPCGGCPWAHLSYDAQIDAKRETVLSTLARIGHLDPEALSSAFREMHPSKNEWGYRNKVEFDVRRENGHLQLGMHARRGGFCEIKSCHLLPAGLVKAPGSVAGALRYLSGNEDHGIERVGIRSSIRTKDTEVAIWTKSGPFPRAQCAKVLSSAVNRAQVTRVMLKGSPRSRKIAGVETLAGKGFWREMVSGSEMLLSAPSFFQVNTRGAEKLIELVLGCLEPDESHRILDLYAGAGTFTLPLVESGADVVAVESYGSSVRDLRRNLDNAGLDAEVVGGDVAYELDVLEDADGAVIDPPKSGLAPSVVTALCESTLPRFVYVSCDPATLARDLASLSGSFDIDSIDCVDLFPQSFHVETVVTLSRR